ncbi:kinase-like protein [Rhizophagus irregularis]|nr:kinase-like protein [Rhizophagus irregularis]
MSSNNKFFGMIPFIDPQKLNHGKNYILDKRSDIYGLGMILWEISSCQTPFYGEDLACLTLKICQGLKEKSVKGTPMEYKHIYTSCWETEPNSRPLIEGVLSRLKSMSLEPVFEEDDKISTISLFQYRDTSRDSTSEYSNNVSSLTIPDDLILPTNNVTCKRCDSKFTDQNWCYDCEAQKFQEDFPNWTSENESLDELIQYSQLSAITNDTYFEWINFNRFNNIENMHSLYYEFYTAIWLDGSRELWDNRSQQWARTGPVKIILRRLKYLTINKLKLYLELKNIIICCYGFTQDPKTKYYYIVLKYANGGILQQYIKNKFPLSWFERLSILKKIVELLHNIHKTNYVYRNLHSGNILLQEDDLNHKLEIYVSDLDSCIYSDYKMRKELYVYTSNIAPENLRGEIISIKSDIYNLGVIMRELTLGNYYNINNPQCYHELMQKCLDNDPENRPNTLDLLEELHIFTASPLRKRQFEDADSRGLQPLQISPPLQKNKRLINPSSEYFSNQFSRGADYSFF